MATTTQASGAGAGAASTAGTTGTADVVSASSTAPGEGEVILPDESTNSEPTEKRPAMKNLKGVQYSGMADERRVTVDDLKRIGVEDPQTDLVWNRANGFLVPATDLNAATVDALIELPGFKAL